MYEGKVESEAQNKSVVECDFSKCSLLLSVYVDIMFGWMSKMLRGRHCAKTMINGFFF